MAASSVKNRDRCDDIQDPFDALLQAQRIWLDCMHATWQNQMSSALRSLKTSAGEGRPIDFSEMSQLRRQLDLARREVERSIERFDLACTALAAPCPSALQQVQISVHQSLPYQYEARMRVLESTNTRPLSEQIS